MLGGNDSLNDLRIVEIVPREPFDALVRIAGNYILIPPVAICRIGSTSLSVPAYGGAGSGRRGGDVESCAG